MPGKPAVYRPPHVRRPADLARETDGRRGSARERGYSTRWDAASAAYLRGHPLCVGCLARERTEAAILTDHVIPHHGEVALFWDRDNWQAACGFCHNAVKQRLELMYGRGEIGAAALRLGSVEAIEVSRELRP